MTDPAPGPSLSRLLKLLKMTTSSSDPEALTAMRMANEEANRFGGWDTIMAGRITVIGDPFLDLKPPRRAGSPPPPPPSTEPPPPPRAAAPPPSAPRSAPPQPSQVHAYQGWADYDAALAARAQAAGAPVDGNGNIRTKPLPRASPTITRPNDPPTAKQVDYALALASQAGVTSINRNMIESMTRQGVSNMIDNLRQSRTAKLNPKDSSTLQF